MYQERHRERGGRGPARRRAGTNALAWQAVLPLALIGAALAVLMLGGGSNRTDVASLMYLRPALVAILAGMAMIVPGAALRPLRWPLALLGLSALLAIVQLVPLPPAWWQALPGRALVADAAAAQGLPQPWRPLSLTPDLTVQALLWFLAPAAALIGWAAVPEERHRVVLLAIAGLGVVSAVLGGLQVAQGPGSALYLYQRTYEGNAVGFLANRNHQAALLALTFPMLRVATLLPARSRQAARNRLGVAALCAVLLIPLVLLTASRTGIALAALGLALTWVVAPLDDVRALLGRAGRYVPWVVASAVLGLVGLVALVGRALALDRLLGLSPIDDLRVRNTPQVLRILQDHFPVGSGLGSFDPVFRIYEADPMLRQTTYNHAHNDFLEVVLTGGLPALVLLVAGLGWWVVAGWRLFRMRGRPGTMLLMARAGWIAMLILMLASIVDYPLRAPILGFVFALSAAWVATALHRSAGVALQNSGPPVEINLKPDGSESSNH